MAEIVNLRRHRKRVERAAKDYEARENRARYGRTKAEHLTETRETERAEKALDGHRLGEAGRADKPV